MSRQEVTYIPYNFTQAVNYESKSAGNLFINRGTSLAKVNNYPLYPGDWVSLDGNTGEIDRSTYKITFEDIPPSGNVNSLYVWQKNYVK